MNGNNPLKILVLLVEDNEGDIGLFREGLNAIGASLTLHIATDGIQAMNFLRQKKPRPHLIVLDLNIPGMNGYEVLEQVKQDADLKEVPVVIFSSSGAARDVKTAYRLQANSFVRKPVDVDEFFSAVASIERFWTRTASLPA